MSGAASMDEAVRELQVKQYELSKTSLPSGCSLRGKSSVLERISRVRLSTDNARSVTEIMLHRRLAPDAKITYESLSLDSGQETLFTSDVKPEEKANVTRKGYVLKVEIDGSKYPDMTLIELPGLRIPDKDESSEEDTFVHVLAEKYMKNNASLILAVVRAKIGC
ncbi:hypothetical protein IFM58399_04273 [Aspergillus lentulus]|uniref:Dynamin N-terminal domain-containing protein n=1 Tax=Aspergillus lentulus TaxID=293939 RepID=A0ABQ1A6S8_ASPLE|nr:uncharacterized protein IFM58399_04273 [Aspergillus lentulus]GFF35602.1 hypothetical protein IFM58399_04273 [Aspergillus lentulus]GFF60300.1 hypothetical protein IFM62136_04540 [Aspergillus lentulus]GFF74945.1 hypothetical protein IFM60648_04321 [Aspergillus lentulus]GFG04822.1 hypothetical protein IFM61392_03517 [Aspergillus lentulus]